MKHFFKLLPAILAICAVPMICAAADTPSLLGAKPSLLPPAVAAPATPPAAPAATAPKASEPAAQQMRVGYVDIARIGTESEPGKASRMKAQEKQKKLQGQIEAKRKQLDKQKAALEKKMPSLEPSQREAKAKEFQRKVDEFQKFGMNAEKELQALQEELSGALFSAIEAAASDYGKTHGLALVLVKRELLYVGNGVDAQDVTDGVIKLLNEKDKK